VLVPGSDRYFIFEARFSPDAQWVSFTAFPWAFVTGRNAGPGQFTQIFVLPSNHKAGEQMARASGLSIGELELARELVTGLALRKRSVAEFAGELGISQEVVRKHVEEVLSKVRAPNLFEVYRKVFRREFVERYWVAMTEGESWNACGRWAPDGRTLYFVSDRGGPANVWGRRFDPEQGRPVGEAFQVTSLAGSARAFPRLYNWQLGVGPNRILVPLQEESGNLWVLENVAR